MYPSINNKTDYNDKLYQAEYAYSHGDYATASMYFIACLNYAQENNMPTEYLEMKIQDSKRNGYTD